MLTLKSRHISKDFVTGDVKVHALRDVSFGIEEGEMIVILGPSGSGKSTMMNILGGIETPTGGEIFFRGEPVSGKDPKRLSLYRRKHVGFIFQFYNLLPGLTAEENVALSAELSETPLSASDLIDRVGLSDRRNHYPAELSGGQQQRVAIARALCKNPDILLCDEPTGALDSKTGEEVLKLIRDFNRSFGKAVVLITHNESIAGMADRIFYFKDGRLEKIVNQGRQ